MADEKDYCPSCYPRHRCICRCEICSEPAGVLVNLNTRRYDSVFNGGVPYCSAHDPVSNRTMHYLRYVEPLERRYDLWQRPLVWLRRRMEGF